MPQIQAFVVDDYQFEAITKAKKKLEASEGEAGANAYLMHLGALAVIDPKPAATKSAPAKKTAKK